MYSRKQLKIIYNNIYKNDINYYKNEYIYNLSNHTYINIDDKNKKLIIFIIIKNIHNKIENKINIIYYICPIVYTFTFLLGFKQFINMI